jgi:hypothetical protein
MAANVQPIFPNVINNGSVAIAASDAQAVKTLYTAATSGSRIMRLNLVSTDTSARDVGIYINSILVSTVNVVAAAGTASATAPKNVFADANMAGVVYYDALGNLVVDLKGGQILGINAPVTLTAAKTITGFVTAGDF